MSRGGISNRSEAMQGFCVLIAAADAAFCQALPHSVTTLEVVDVGPDGLLCREGSGQIRSFQFPPTACLGLFGDRASRPLLENVRDWMLERGGDPAPDPVLTDGADGPAHAARAMLERLLALSLALARSAAEHAQQVASLRVEVEAMAAARADVDRFLGETGLAQMPCVFGTREPDYETQIELTPGSPLRQLLPIPSAGFAAIDLACAAAPKRRSNLIVRLTSLEEAEILAEWQVPPPVQDGWVRLGLPRAGAGLTRTLVLTVEPASARTPCANLALGGHQPLAAAQLADAETGESIAPHSLAFRAYAALPGTTPPHTEATLLPVAAEPLRRAPFALKAVPHETLARLAPDGVSDEAREADGPPALFIPEAGAILCRPGFGGQVPGALPAGARGLALELSIHADVARALTVRLRVAGSGVRSGARILGGETLTIGSSNAQTLSLMLPAPLAAPADLRFEVDAVQVEDGAPAWAVFSRLRIYQ
ncbi:DUF6212 domain-containing protein [Methylobacterium oxalidis]|uniref:DUF6212 domain-containing protein n=1 Tax=Methylobacterium oxalidis TaxID=944322 RepID=UPI0033155E2A